MTDYITISQAKELIPFEIKSKTQIFIYLRSGQIPGMQKSGKWYIRSSYIAEAIAWRQNTCTLDELIHRVVGKPVDPQTKRRIRETAYPVFVRNTPLSLLFTGEFFISSESESRVVEIIASETSLRSSKHETMTLREAAKELGISIYRLRKQILAGKISGERVKNDWRIRKDDVEKTIENRMKFVSIYETACRIAKEENTLFDPDNRYDRNFLNQHLKSSPIGEYLYRAEEINLIETVHNSYFYPATISQRVESLIRKYFRRYGSKKRLKDILEDDSFWERYPVTKAILDEYISNQSAKAATYLQDILMHTLKCEITECKDDDIKVMKEYVDDIGIAFASHSWIKFIRFLHLNYDCKFSIEIYRSARKKQTDSESILPYKREQFFRMSYMTFREEYINESGLVEKAIADPKNAYIWLYAAMHYLGAWRKSDIDLSLPILQLPYSPEETIGKIRHDDFSQDATMLSIQLEGEFNNRIIAPHKTRNKQNSRGLKLFIPTSLRSVFGMIYAIYAYHVHSGHKFTKNITGSMFSHFFGKPYEIIFGTKPFSNRRANKTYMDIIEENASKGDNAAPNIVGCMVVQYGRAHVKGSQATYRYLSTKMDGLDKNEILMLLFESGFCSFITDSLLQLVYGDNYKSLDINSQNSIISHTKLDAYTSEALTSVLDTAYSRSQNALSTMFQEYTKESDKKYVAEKMITNLATRTSLSKTAGISCLCSAMRRPCINPSRDCFGCSYGIYETSFFYLALKKVEEAYKKLREAKTIGEKNKNQMLIDQEILPAITEFICVAETRYGMDLYEQKQKLIDIITHKGAIENDTSD